MQTNYVMEHLNDYNENAKIFKIKFWFRRVCLSLLFSWKCAHKCGLGFFLTFIISCICVEGYDFLFQWYLHKLCNGIIKYMFTIWYKSIISKNIKASLTRVINDLNNTLQYPFFSHKYVHVVWFTSFHPLHSYYNTRLTYYCNFQYGTARGLQGALGKLYLT